MGTAPFDVTESFEVLIESREFKFLETKKKGGGDEKTGAIITACQRQRKTQTLR